jgi:hypothetical protein
LHALYITEPFIFYSATYYSLAAPELLNGLLAALPPDAISGNILTLDGISPCSSYLQLLILPWSTSHAHAPKLALNNQTSTQIIVIQLNYNNYFRVYKFFVTILIFFMLIFGTKIRMDCAA